MFSAVAPRQGTLSRMALASCAFEAAVILLIVACPLVWTPRLAPMMRPLMPPGSVFRAEPLTPTRQRATHQAAPTGSHALVVSRRSISLLHLAIKSEENDDGAPDPVNWLPGRLTGSTPTLLAPNSPPPLLNRQSTVIEGNLLRKVEPEYPPLARQMHLEGTVVLKAVISPQGTVENLEVVSGHPLLARAASEAIRQWLYRPYYLNRQPIEIETEITIHFRLAR